MRDDLVGVAIGMTEFSVVECVSTIRLSAVVLDISMDIVRSTVSSVLFGGANMVGGIVVVSFS